MPPASSSFSEDLGVPDTPAASYQGIRTMMCPSWRGVAGWRGQRLPPHPCPGPGSPEAPPAHFLQLRCGCGGRRGCPHSQPGSSGSGGTCGQMYACQAGGLCVHVGVCCTPHLWHPVSVSCGPPALVSCNLPPPRTWPPCGPHSLRVCEVGEGRVRTAPGLPQVQGLWGGASLGSQALA